MKNQKGFALIIIFLIVILTGALGYFGYVKGFINLNSSELNNEVVPSKENKTTDRKTYVNEEAGYSINYPEDWTIFGENNLSQQIMTNLENEINTSPNDTLGLERPQILIQVSEGELDYKKKSDVQNLGSKKYGVLEGSLFSWNDVFEANKFKFDEIGLDFVTFINNKNILFRLFTTSQNKLQSEKDFFEIITSFKPLN